MSINQWEACLISKGCKQEYRIDYDETFALATKMTSAREVIMCMSMAFVMHFFLREFTSILVQDFLISCIIFVIWNTLYGLNQALHV